MELLLPRFRAAHTQVLGISVDSVFCHANWAQGMNGISFPLLADFHPKGAVASAYGLYLEQAGITDRATVIIDAAGVVRHASSVTPSGKRDIAALAGLCEGVDRGFGRPLPASTAPASREVAQTLYVKSKCGHSRKVLLARDNLHLQDRLPIKNVSDDAVARNELVRLAGEDTAPCLVIDDKPMHEADEIVRHLVREYSDLS